GGTQRTSALCRSAPSLRNSAEQFRNRSSGRGRAALAEFRRLVLRKRWRTSCVGPGRSASTAAHAGKGRQITMRIGKHQVGLALVCGLTMICGCADDVPRQAKKTAEFDTAGQISYAYDALGRLIQAAA